MRRLQFQVSRASSSGNATGVQSSAAITEGGACTVWPSDPNTKVDCGRRVRRRDRPTTPLLDDGVGVAAAAGCVGEGRWGGALAGDVSDDIASLAHADLVALTVELFSYDVLAERIWELRGAVTAYDGWYVALAESLKVPLATLDDRLTRAPGPRCSFIGPP